MKFTLRDLFWLILVVGLCFGWYLDRVENASLRAQMQVIREEMKILSNKAWLKEFGVE